MALANFDGAPAAAPKPPPRRTSHLLPTFGGSSPPASPARLTQPHHKVQQLEEERDVEGPACNTSNKTIKGILDPMLSMTSQTDASLKSIIL